MTKHGKLLICLAAVSSLSAPAFAGSAGSAKDSGKKSIETGFGNSSAEATKGNVVTAGGKSIRFTPPSATRANCTGTNSCFTVAICAKNVDPCPKNLIRRVELAAAAAPVKSVNPLLNDAFKSQAEKDAAATPPAIQTVTAAAFAEPPAQHNPIANPLESIRDLFKQAIGQTLGLKK